MAKDRERWWALVNSVMNLQDPLMCGISRIPENLLASQEGFSSMELVS